jgi:hypothetical protein
MNAPEYTTHFRPFLYLASGSQKPGMAFGKQMRMKQMRIGDLTP